MLNESEEFKVGFSSLTRGVLYPIKSIAKTEAKFHGKTTKGMKVIVLDDDLEVSTHLPKKLMDSITDADLTKINHAGDTDEKYSVCYYGKLENTVTVQFVGRIHEPGQTLFEKLFNDVGKIMAKYNPTTTEKRQVDDEVEESPKKAKIE